VVLSILGLATGIIAARLLGPQGRGELAAIQTWPSFLATIGMLGIPEALVYFSAREADQAGRHLGSAMILALLASLPVMLGCYLAVPLLLSAQSNSVIKAARWYLFLVPIFALVSIPCHALRGRSDLAVWNAVRVMPNIAWLAVLVMAWLLAWAEPELMAGSYLMALALLFFPVIYVVTRRIRGPFWPDFGKAGRMLRYGLPNVLSSVPQMLNLRLDQMLIAVALPAKVLGFYVIAVAYGSAVSPFLNALATVLFPRVAAEGDRDRQVTIFARGIRFGVLLSMVMALVFSLLTPWILPLLFGAEFASAVPAAVILVLAGTVAGLNLIMEEGLRGLGAPAAVLKAECIGLLTTAPALLLLLAPLEILGAAMASVLGAASVTTALVTQARRLTGCAMGDLLCPTGVELAWAWGSLRAFALGSVKEP
jgi:O-antigen/teichoic acid export membrane protein